MKRFAFTLAEVLITLGVIGVVAAMTLPTVIKNYQKHETVIKLKKTYSDIMNVHKRAVVDFGDPSLWSYPNGYNDPQLETFIKTYYLPYLNGAKFYTKSEFYNKLKHEIKNLNGELRNGVTYSGIVLSDGRILRFYPNGNYMWIFADINGFKGPNKVGKDVFVLILDEDSKYIPRFYGIHWNRYLILNHGTGLEEKDKDKNTAGMGCSKENKYGFYAGWACGALIMHDGWKIKDDYPW